MKHCYSLLMLLTFGLIAFSANARQFMLNIDHADRVTVAVNGVSQKNLVDGDNMFEVNVNNYESVSIRVKEGFLFSSVMNRAGVSQPVLGNEVTLYTSPYSTDSELSYTVATLDLAEACTATLTVKVDEPSRVRLRTYKTWREISLDSTEEKVKFIPGVESPFGIEPADNDYSDFNIYKVTLNGSAMSRVDGQYSISAKDGDVLEITMNYPDEDFTVRINEKKDAGFIDKVVCGGVEVSDWSSFTAIAGSKVTVTGNLGEYCLEKIVNGDDVITAMYSDGYTFVVGGDTEVDVYARKWGTFSISIDVDDAENVSIFRDDVPVTLTSGCHDYTFVESGDDVTLNISSSSKGKIKRLKFNGSKVDCTYGVYLTVHEGDEIVITTEKIERESEAVIFFEGRDDIYYLDFSNAESHKEIHAVTEGYNRFGFGAADNPVRLAFQPKESLNADVFVNGKRISPEYEGSFTYTLELADKDVIKVFVNGAPEKYSLSFVMPEDTEGISLKHDHVAEVSDFTVPSTAHKGTLYTLTLPETSSYIVTLGTEQLFLDDSNSVGFTPTGDTVLTVKTEQVGIEYVAPDAAHREVYNLQGMRIDADPLPAGIYIMDGRKVIVK